MSARVNGQMKAALPRASRALPVSGVRTAVGLCAAALLAWLVVTVNVQRACTAADTPYLPLCKPEPVNDADQAARLRARIAANPGDTAAYVRLALVVNGESRAAVLDTAARLAPQHGNVLMMRAVAAIERQDWPAATAPLVQLAERYDPAAATVLARLIAAGHGNALAGYITPGNRWFLFTLKQLRQKPAELATAIPLIATALKNRGLDREAAGGFIADLKAAGAWTDAYSLWLSLHPDGLPALYNPGFELPLEPNGFDWEVPGRVRSGVVAGREPAGARGWVLQVNLTGRPMTLPLARQYVFLAPGRYRFEGAFRTASLRMEQGLAWTVRCTRDGAATGRSQALLDSGGSWQPFSFEFEIPPGCGDVAAIELETFAPFEARTGARGTAAFDDFKLEKAAAPKP